MPDDQLSPPLLADSRGLDFLNTLWVPLDVAIEGLADGRRFLDWLLAAGLIDEDAAQEVLQAANPGELDAVAAQARALREWFRGFVSNHRGKPLTKRAITELEPLNRLLARDEEYGQLIPRAKDASEGGLPLTLVLKRRWRAPEAVLSPLAKAMAELVATADFTDVKRCEGHACVLHFLDTTRDRRRRWCSMAVCGNRAKQAKLRAQRAAS
jgi:predicted RNA-binding Zn ribbon-like protein